MDGHRFDDLTRALARGTSRRAVLRGLGAGLFAGVTGAARSRAAGAQAQATACASTGDCPSFFCVDGYCCDTTCTGQCEACNVEGAEGTCTPVSGQPVGDRSACSGSDPCTAACDGQTTTHCAAYPDSETSCGEPTCAGGMQTTQACGGNGACVATTTNCAPFGCDATGVACATGCQDDADCPTGSHCAAEQCVVDDGIGAPCAGDGDCLSGVCVDDICCVERCGACQVCNLPGAEGFCGPGPDAGTCGDGGVCCDDGCVDTSTDVEHCDGCNQPCLGVPNGFAVCAQGACGFGCLDGFKVCADACIPGDDCCTVADCVPTPGACEGEATCDAGACVFAPATDGVCRTAPDGCHADAVCDGQSTSCPPNPELCTSEQCCAGQCCPDDQRCDGGACVPICLALDEACTTTEECCQDAPTVCADDTCQPCGGLDQPCCPEGDTCAPANNVCVDGFCRVCGILGNLCCPPDDRCLENTFCDADSNTCQNCGRPGQPCCPTGVACRESTICDADTNTCQLCGEGAEPCGAECCPPDLCCEGTCCTEGQPCFDGACGCPEGDITCGDTCCHEEQVCCAGTCCSGGTVCCGDNCCEPGED